MIDIVTLEQITRDLVGKQIVGVTKSEKTMSFNFHDGSQFEIEVGAHGVALTFHPSSATKPS